MQLLLRKKAGSLSDSEWDEFMQTMDHVDDLRKDEAKGELAQDRWHDVQLMSQGAHRYSGTHETLTVVQSMMARACKPYGRWSLGLNRIANGCC